LAYLFLGSPSENSRLLFFSMAIRTAVTVLALLLHAARGVPQASKGGSQIKPDAMRRETRSMSVSATGAGKVHSLVMQHQKNSNTSMLQKAYTEPPTRIDPSSDECWGPWEAWDESSCRFPGNGSLRTCGEGFQMHRLRKGSGAAQCKEADGRALVTNEYMSKPCEDAEGHDLANCGHHVNKHLRDKLGESFAAQYHGSKAALDHFDDLTHKWKDHVYPHLEGVYNSTDWSGNARQPASSHELEDFNHTVDDMIREIQELMKEANASHLHHLSQLDHQDTE